MVSAKQIGAVITRLRNEKGLSQEILSGLAGLDRTHYSKIGRGLRSPTIDTLFKIAQSLDISPDRLIREIELEVVRQDEESGGPEKSACIYSGKRL